MKLTPLDIRQATFGSSFRGYDRKEVDFFLETVAREFEVLARENMEFRERLLALESTHNELKKKEGALTDALVSAQKIMDEMKANAQKEGELILKEAELKAEGLIRAATAELSHLHGEIFDLRRQRDLFIEKLRSYVRGFERALLWDEGEGQEEIVRPQKESLS